jgi:hypothetical protein
MSYLESYTIGDQRMRFDHFRATMITPKAASDLTTDGRSTGSKAVVKCDGSA